MRRPAHFLSPGPRQGGTAPARAGQCGGLPARRRAALPSHLHAWAPRGRGGLPAAAARVASLGTSDNAALSDVAVGHGPCTPRTTTEPRSCFGSQRRSSSRTTRVQGPRPPAPLAPLDITLSAMSPCAAARFARTRRGPRLALPGARAGRASRPLHCRLRHHQQLRPRNGRATRRLVRLHQHPQPGHHDVIYRGPCLR